MDEYREALKYLTEQAKTVSDVFRSRLGVSVTQLDTAIYAAKALLARGEPEAPYRVRSFWSPERKHLVNAYVSIDDITLMDDNGDIWEPTGDEQDMSKLEPPKFEPAAAEKPLTYETFFQRAREIGWNPSAKELREQLIAHENAAADKAREPMHEGLPLNTRVSHVESGRTGVLVSYHCRFEVWWDDGTKSMDVPCSHLEALPSPPAATGDQP